jgi:hypothetical protein
MKSYWVWLEYRESDEDAALLFLSLIVPFPEASPNKLAIVARFSSSSTTESAWTMNKHPTYHFQTSKHWPLHILQTLNSSNFIRYYSFGRPYGVRRILDTFVSYRD